MPHELRKLQQELPQVLLSAAQKLKASSVQQAEQYYKEFLDDTLLEHEAERAGTENLLPILHLLSQAELHLPASQGFVSHGTVGNSDL